MSEKKWRDVERLVNDLRNDGYCVKSIRTNNNPVSGDKLLLIGVKND